MKTWSCNGIISKDEVFKSLKYMENNKSPWDDERILWMLLGLNSKISFY